MSAIATFSASLPRPLFQHEMAKQNLIRAAGAVFDAVDAGLPIKLRRIGVPDCFSESGSLPSLIQRYHMDTASIAATTRELCRSNPAFPKTRGSVDT